MIYLIDLEYVETRYTAQWKTEFPQQIADETGQDITVIEGPEDIAACTTPGAFLNFAGTNIYKSEQVKILAEYFNNNEIKNGDHFVFADAWHPGILNLKYMLDLFQIDATIHGLWHAGSYDPQDFLGRLIGDKKWVRHTEYALFDAIDKNYFASIFHINLFAQTMYPGEENEEYLQNKIIRSGWPMEYLGNYLQPKRLEKQKTIVFPHRNAPEKQLNIFEDLALEMPEYDWINCNDYDLTKKDYNELLESSMMVFSANLQETLGISCYEILMAGGMPLVPNRLSYIEMYDDIFKYPSKCTDNWKNYKDHKEMLVGKIRTMMENFHSPEIQTAIKEQRDKLTEQYFTATNLYQELR